VNPRLVMCLFAAMFVGIVAAGAALHAGWHPLLALLVYSLAGSVAVVACTLVAVPHRAPRLEPGPVRLAALAAPQST